MPFHSVQFNAFRRSTAETLPQLYIRIMTSCAQTIFPGSGGGVCKFTCPNVGCHFEVEGISLLTMFGDFYRSMLGCKKPTFCVVPVLDQLVWNAAFSVQSTLHCRSHYLGRIVISRDGDDRGNGYVDFRFTHVIQKNTFHDVLDPRLYISAQILVTLETFSSPLTFWMSVVCQDSITQSFGKTLCTGRWLHYSALQQHLYWKNKTKYQQITSCHSFQGTRLWGLV